MTQTLIKIIHSTFKVATPKGLAEVENLQKGTWTKYEVGTEELYLHASLGIAAATKLCLWEEVSSDLKVTRNEKDKVVGLAVRKGAE